MEDSYDPSVINFDVVPFGSKHWCVVVDSTRSPVPFTSRKGAAAAARAQARQFHLYRGLPTQVRIAGVDGRFSRTHCYNHNALNKVTFVPLATRSTVSQRETLVTNTDRGE